MSISSITDVGASSLSDSLAFAAEVDHADIEHFQQGLSVLLTTAAQEGRIIVEEEQRRMRLAFHLPMTPPVERHHLLDRRV